MRGQLEFDIGNVTVTSLDADGFQETQYSADGDDKAGVPSYETHHFFGSWGRPLDASTEPTTPGQPATNQVDPQKSAQVLYAMEGGQGHSWAMEDPRIVAVLGNIPGSGEHLTYGANPTAGENYDTMGVCFTRHDSIGQITQSTTTTGGANDGQSIYTRVGPTGFTRVSPYGIELFGSQGNGAWIGYSLSVHGGARMTLGYAGGVLPGQGSYVRFQASMIELNAAAVKIGPAGAPAGSVTKVLPLTAALGQLTAAAQGLASGAIALATAAAAIPGATPAVAAAGALIQSASSALSAAASAIAALPTSAGTQTGLG
jgi:hypothetical protein